MADALADLGHAPVFSGWSGDVGPGGEVHDEVGAQGSGQTVEYRQAGYGAARLEPGYRGLGHAGAVSGPSPIVCAIQTSVAVDDGLSACRTRGFLPGGSCSSD
jgi:hypothetical protein